MPANERNDNNRVNQSIIITLIPLMAGRNCVAESYVYIIVLRPAATRDNSIRVLSGFLTVPSAYMADVSQSVKR